MKKKHLLVLIAFAIVPLMACTSTSDANKQAAIAHEQAEPIHLAFLDELGVKSSMIKVIDDGICSDDNVETVTLEEGQASALLPHVKRMIDAEGNLEGNFWVEAARALSGGYVMLLMGQEYGDDANEMIAVYNPEGQLTDWMNLGNWNEFSTVQCDDEMTHGQARVTRTSLDFESSSEFVITKEVKLVDWTRPASQQELPTNFTKQYWKRSNTMRYAVDGEGHISLVDSKAQVDGIVPQDDIITDELVSIAYLPVSDKSRIDRLNEKAIELLRTYPDSDWFYLLKAVLSNIYMSQPQELLQWIYDHRKDSQQIVSIFDQLFSDGWYEKSVLVDDIRHMTDAAAKQYLEELTAQWGPLDAVG